MNYFEEVQPESVGIRAEGITAFLEAVKKNGLELHSLMVIRHGKCAGTAWFYPYGPEKLHPIYSFSKSFTAAAIGFAWQEGILSLDERVIDIFPEYAPENPSEYLKEMTLHHLLCMSCGHETLIQQESPNWISEFLHHPVLHKPGTYYLYNSAGTNLLSAVITKKTGLSLMEYLQPRLFEPLGINQVTCHRLPDIMHTCAGGNGMKLTTEDMAKFSYFMLHDGEWEGKKILTGWYEQATKKQMETAGDAEGHIKEWANGYGYQCWLGSLPGSFRADGAFGQFGFVFPSLDLIVVTTAATEQTQTLVDCMYEHLIKAVDTEDMIKEENERTKTTFFSDLQIPALLSCRNPKVEMEISNGIYEISDKKEAMSSFEKLVGGAGLFCLQDDTSIHAMRFYFEEKRLIWTVKDGNEEKKVIAALDGCFSNFTIGKIAYAASARWRSLYALEMEIRRIDAISGVRLIFRFDGTKLSIEADETLITVGGLGMNEKHLTSFLFQERMHF